MSLCFKYGFYTQLELDYFLKSSLTSMYFNRRRISSLAYILVNLYQQFELFLCPAFPLVFFKLVDLLSFSSFHLFLAVLDLHCCMGFSLVMVNGGYSLAVVNEVLIVVASLVMEPWL